MLELAAGDYRLELAPERGGAILCFEWRGHPLFRPVCGPTIFDVASFPLVPFSNRIAWGRFRWGEGEVVLRPNFPGSDHPHTLHGFGWLAEWKGVEVTENMAVLEHHYPGGEWPWPYRAQQRLVLSDEGLSMTLSVTNMGDSPMPAGLGFHPYFPRDPDTVYVGRHAGEWQNDRDCVPDRLIGRDRAEDWWDGRPVGSRAVDTAYAGREGPLLIRWPSRGYALSMTPSDNMDHTVVYTPAGQDFFCIEPVSHMTDAFNRGPDKGCASVVAPHECLEVTVRITAESFPAC